MCLWLAGVVVGLQASIQANISHGHVRVHPNSKTAPDALFDGCEDAGGA